MSNAHKSGNTQGLQNPAWNNSLSTERGATHQGPGAFTLTRLPDQALRTWAANQGPEAQRLAKAVFGQSGTR
jgi:hypothetical protein